MEKICSRKTIQKIRMSPKISTNYTKTQHNLWQQPWGYVESFLIVFGTLTIGFLWEIFIGKMSVHFFVFPMNVLIGFLYVLSLIVFQKYLFKWQLVMWFTSIPATITLLISVLLMVLLMGIFPQSPSSNTLVNVLGLNHITSHWAFYLIQFLLLTALGLVTVKRAFPFKLNNVGFILNHAGLFIALLAGLLGANDVQKLKIIITEKADQQIAINEQNHLLKMDFKIYLHDFQMDEYLPKLTVVNNNTGNIVLTQGNIEIDTIKKTSFIFKDYQIEVEKYLSSAGKIDDRYVAVRDVGTPPAVFLKITNLKTKELTSSWVSCGSFLYPYEAAKLNDQFSVLMTFPEPKKFNSKINIFGKDTIQNIDIEVNKPFSYDGWEIYQLSYDENKGKWSQTSTLEMVKDPWLPVVYIGVFMMIAGAIYLFWKAPKGLNSKHNTLKTP